ncbi:hypothetical protein [Escherichia coli]|uniref:hypothetical protein n=1 Tax=Escherichia coli TaxID=562 RepID=UPI00157A98A7|nr:hypothetical protein [Escherichia coli]
MMRSRLIFTCAQPAGFATLARAAYAVTALRRRVKTGRLQQGIGGVGSHGIGS